MSPDDELSSRGARVDLDSANAARMYDYYLGGAHNFAVDRERAEAAIAVHPQLRYMARANRAFLGRVVRWCLAERGIDQFLDLGSGVPTVGNVHEVAHQHHPDARVAYVDFEPVAVAHAATIISDAGLTNVTVTRADAREPTVVLGAPGVRDLLDFARPIALLAVALFSFVDGDMAELLGRYRAELASGSVVAITQASDDLPDAGVAAEMRAIREAYASAATPAVLRTRDELRRGLEGLELTGPGLVDLVDWPAPTDGQRSWLYGAVGIVR